MPKASNESRVSGRLELTWSNKTRRLLGHENATYEWTEPGDYRVSEVRLLREVGVTGKLDTDEQTKGSFAIQGDALHALTALLRLPEYSEEFAGKIRLAYLDPPFNTRLAFKHYDDGLDHSVWLTMMRDRMAQVRELLSSSGSIWVHLDDTEAAYCKMLMDEIFGRDNFAGSIIWRSSDNSNNDAKQFSGDHNTILIYGKERDWNPNRRAGSDDQLSHYSNPDNDPRGPWFDGNPLNSPKPRPNLRYTIPSPTGHKIPPPPNGWRWSRETLEEKIESGEIRFTPDGRGIRRRTYLADHKGLPASSLWTDIEETGHNRQAKYELRRLFPDLPTSELFATPKPERLLHRILELATDPGDIVLDCFAGSGTTAAVAHKMRRRWVAIELEAATMQTFLLPRLNKVVAGEDPGGVTNVVGWRGGSGFRTLSVAQSMFTLDEGRVVLAPWTVDSALAEVVAAQAGFVFSPRPPFAGRKGKMLFAVVDGLVNDNVCGLLVSWLEDDQRLCVYGTAIDPSCRASLQDARRGSLVKQIPQSILRDYQRLGSHDFSAEWEQAFEREMIEVRTAGEAAAE